MEVQYAKKDDGVKDCLYPEQFLKFITFLSKSLLDENTIKEFNRKKIPLSDTLLTNLIFVWDSLIRIDVNCAKFFELLQPIPPAEWILSLPMVFFSVFNPCHFHVVYQLLFRFINLALHRVENKEEQLNKKIPRWKLKQIFTGLASFGIVAERLFAYLEGVVEWERNIKHFIQNYHRMLLYTILSLDEDCKKTIAEIPQIWLLFSHSLETYSSKITVVGELMTVFENILEPWMYELENVAPFHDNPAFPIAVDSFMKLLSPTGPVMKKSKVPESTLPVLARLCGVSVDFATKLREIVSFKMITNLRDKTVELADLALLLWRILEQADDTLVEHIVLASETSLRETMAVVLLSTAYEDAMPNDRDSKMFHGCRLFTVLVEKSEQLASNGRNKLKNAFNELIHEEGALDGLDTSLSFIIQWASTRKRVGFKSSENYIADLFRSSGFNLNRGVPPQFKRQVDEIRMQLQMLTPQCSDINKIVSSVNKLLNTFSRFDKRFTKKIEKLRKKYHFPA